MKKTNRLFPKTIPSNCSQEYKSWHNFIWEHLNKSHRNLIEEKWSNFSPYVEKDTLHRFRNCNNNIHSIWWEITLADYLIKSGFKILPRTQAGPDFLVKCPKGNKFYIEATSMGSGKSEDRVPDPDLEEVASIEDDKIDLRIIEGIRNKLKQAPKNDIPYIVAINTGQIWCSWDLDRVLKVVYPIGSQICIFNKNNDNVKWRYAYRDKIIKGSGKKKETALFLKTKYSRISAVLYSVGSPFKNVFSENWLSNEFSLVHNIGAKNPLKRKVLRVDEEWVLENPTELRNIK